MMFSARGVVTDDVRLSISDHAGYTLYGIERAGLASGFKRFGQHDWFRELGQGVIATRNKKEGSWNGSDGPRAETGPAGAQPQPSRMTSATRGCSRPLDKSR